MRGRKKLSRGKSRRNFSHHAGAMHAHRKNFAGASMVMRGGIAL